ncbi:MAG TPA: hypothetical protein VHK90_15520 [Thermoanaerobaculia bacterium]|nr:hypothetical protein [Thermoanaerobaculia bacterium]
MVNYHVNNNAQANGDHEVHRDGCSFMPSNTTYLGVFNNCHDAVNAARRYYSQVNGCAFCAGACHTQ